ncbi:MAG: hypothetical protein OJF47_003611 [Nitrospira sp.]|nr:MAG: hypothetical protein OJF47_003611 [Nitrospira sp.]
MPSPYSSIDASTMDAIKTMQVQRLRIVRGAIGMCRHRVICEIS